MQLVIYDYNLFVLGEKTKRSGVWMWFKENEDDRSKATCTVCNKVLSCGIGKKRSPSSLLKHLRSLHTSHYKISFPDIKATTNEERDCESEDDYQPILKKPKFVQKSLAECYELAKKWALSDIRAVKHHYAIGEMIALDVLPFSFVENEGFRRFLSVIQPHYKVTSCCLQAIMKDLLYHYKLNLNEAFNE